MYYKQQRMERLGRSMRSKRQNTLNVEYDKYVDRRLNKGPRAVPKTWDWELNDQSGVVTAFTRSEARAQLKERFGLKRLPKGVYIAPRGK